MELLQPFFVWDKKALRRIHPDQVLWLATEGNYTKIFLENRSFFMVRSSLSNALKKLPPEMFLQIHRSFAVSIHYIDKVTRDHLEIYDVLIPIGKQYYKEVMGRLNVIE
jgi:DNA-binding LytR/AlgR family response regulator